MSVFTSLFYIALQYCIIMILHSIAQYVRRLERIDDDDDEVMLNVLRCQLTYQGQVVTNAEARFNNSLRPRKPEGSLGRTDKDVHLDSHTAPELYERID